MVGEGSTMSGARVPMAVGAARQADGCLIAATPPPVQSGLRARTVCWRLVYGGLPLQDAATDCNMPTQNDGPGSRHVTLIRDTCTVVAVDVGCRS